jgi:hypothetical protein
MIEYTVQVYDNRTEWRNAEGQIHREDGPAIEYTDGTKQWWANGKPHRVDGPAVEHSDGTKVWYLHGTYIRSEIKIKITKSTKQVKVPPLV